MTCECIAEVDAMLAARNTRIMLPIMIGADQTPRPMIVTDQIEGGRGKKKAVGMFATFCPFCGFRYGAENSAPSGVTVASEGEVKRVAEAIAYVASLQSDSGVVPKWSDYRDEARAAILAMSKVGA